MDDALEKEYWQKLGEARERTKTYLRAAVEDLWKIYSRISKAL